MNQKDIDRFWSKVVKSDGCWVWKGETGRYGRGRIHAEGRYVQASHLSYRINRGAIPSGLFVLHSCDNPNCINPDHLFLGTQTDNMRDMARKGRGYLQKHPEKTQGEKHPMHKLTTDQVLMIRSTKGVKHGVLAKTFGVCRQSIDNIFSGKRWGHVK